MQARSLSDSGSGSRRKKEEMESIEHDEAIGWTLPFCASTRCCHHDYVCQIVELAVGYGVQDCEATLAHMKRYFGFRKCVDTPLVYIPFRQLMDFLLWLIRQTCPSSMQHVAYLAQLNTCYQCTPFLAALRVLTCIYTARH